MSLLHSLARTTHPAAKRVGRGYGSGRGGHTSGRGTKGQGARVGAKRPHWFEGGQLPLVKRLPMWRGKGRFNVVRPTARVTLTDLEGMEAKTITLDTLKLEKVIAARFKKAKVVKTGRLARAVVLEGILVSVGARAAIEAAGGRVDLATSVQPAKNID